MHLAGSSPLQQAHPWALHQPGSPSHRACPPAPAPAGKPAPPPRPTPPGAGARRHRVARPPDQATSAWPRHGCAAHLGAPLMEAA